MEKLLTIPVVAAAFLVSAFAPVTGHAFLTPDQVFGDSSTTFDRTDATSHPQPPLPREGDAVIQQQQQVSAENRAAAQSQLQPVDAEPVDTYVPPASGDSSLGLFNDNTQYQRRIDRIEATHAAAPTIIIGNDGTVVDSSGNVLHSGAPLMTSSGPETVLALAALLLSALCTVGYVAVRTRFQHLSLQ